MTFEITKEWKEVPFAMFTIQGVSELKLRIDTGETAPTGNGQTLTGQTIARISDSKVWIKLDQKNVGDTVTVEIGNFI